MNIVESMNDPKLFDAWFHDRESWAAWRAFLSALFGLPPADGDEATYKACTERSEWPDEPYREAVAIVGRRGGKTQCMALLGVFLAAFKDWRPYLKPGEKAAVLAVSADRDQARNLLGYMEGLATQAPLVAKEVKRTTADTIEFRNDSVIRVTTASHRTSRGYTAAAVLADEAAFWRTESSNTPDVEVIRALRPALATLPGSMLIIASSPYARRGVLYEAYKDYFGKDNAPVLVWKAPSLTMNPSLDKRIVEREMEADESAARAEWLAEFRTDVEAFISREVVEAAIETDRHEIAPARGVRYFGFVDPSGGSADSFTLAIAHKDGDEVVLDAIRETKPPFRPDDVVQDYCKLLKSYGVSTVAGDRYAGMWPRERFQEHGVTYTPTKAPKSDIYRDVLPMLNSGKVRLLDNKRLVNQLTGLERRTSRSGRDSIDHAPRSHDDVANAAAGAIVGATQEREWVFSLGDLNSWDADFWEKARAKTPAPRVPSMKEMSRLGRPLF